MKRCPSCRRAYADDSLAFCLEDGTALVNEGGSASDMPATLIMADPRVTIPQRPETVRPTQPAPPVIQQPYMAQPPFGSPAAPPQAFPTANARPGRGAALTSLFTGIAAFLLLAFCIIGGAAGVNNELLGGIFIFSVLVALVGAVFGIVAFSKTRTDTSPQNSKATAVAGLVISGVYLLISVVLLILSLVSSSPTR